MASFCWIELGESWHFIQAFKQPISMISFEEKNRKNYKKLKKNFGFFWRSSLTFSKMVNQNEFWFFALQSVNQDTSFKLSIDAIQHFSFFTFALLKEVFEEKNARMPKIGVNKPLALRDKQNIQALMTKTQILKLWQKSKNQIATKLKKLKLWQKSKTRIVTELKNSNGDKTQKLKKKPWTGRLERNLECILITTNFRQNKCK